MSRIVELLRLIEACGSIVGRKKLQKMVHILKEAGHAFPYRYGFHYHGAFSAELKAELDALASQGFVEETEDDSFFAGFRQYKYGPTDRTSAFIQGLGFKTTPAWMVLAKRLNGKAAQDLEAISTILFLLRHGCPEAALRIRFAQLKPKLIDRFDASMQFISEEFAGRTLPLT